MRNTLSLLKIRGNAMQSAVPKNEGGMVAVLGSDIDIIEDILGNPTENLLDDTEADYLEMKAELAMGI